MSNDIKLREWLIHTVPSLSDTADIHLIAGDASPRRYYRVTANNAATTWIAVISPPSEKNVEFLHIRQLFQQAGVRVPALFAANPEGGFLLLEDLGDDHLWQFLSSAGADHWYPEALSLLMHIASIPPASAGLPPYDPQSLQIELNLFPEWFLDRLLVNNPSGGSDASLAGGRQPPTSHPDFAALFHDFSQRLIESAQEQPQVVVHRDFHSRNLMRVVNGKDESTIAACANSEPPTATLAVIDFQGAVIGPIAYDPASLLKDCYVAWPRARQLAWLESYRQRLGHGLGLLAIDRATFERWFDLAGLQRHIKVLGIFARLSIRDGKDAYLQELPLVLAYIREVLALYANSEPAIGAFGTWFDAEVIPLCEQQSWYRAVEY